MMNSFINEMLKLVDNETTKNLKYILGHKYHVYKGGREIDLPRLRLLKHDLSKLRLSEFMPYKRFFFGERTPEVEKAFQSAVKKHYKRNPHHHTKGTSLETELEKIVDWYGASKRQKTHRFKTFKSWYKKNRDKLKIDKNIKEEINRRLKIYS